LDCHKLRAIRTEFPLPANPAGIPNAGHSKPARVCCQDMRASLNHCAQRFAAAIVGFSIFRDGMPIIIFRLLRAS
jgi:hypothetical protein